MGLRSLFGRRQKAAARTIAAPIAVSEPATEEPLTPEELSELQEAWAEFADAVKGSGVHSVHGCTRNGKPWQEDAVAVRSMAALLRRVRDEDATSGTEPAGRAGPAPLGRPGLHRSRFPGPPRSWRWRGRR